MTYWYTNHTSYSGYILFNFIAFPVISWAILFFVILYFNSFAPEPRMKKIKSVLESSNKEKIWACKLSLQSEFTLSLIFVLFSTCLSSSAVAFAYNTENHEHHEVSKYFTRNFDVPIGVRRIFSLGYVVLGLDVVVLAIMFACGIFCKCISKCEGIPKLFNYMHSVSAKDQECAQLTKSLTSAIKTLAAAARNFQEGSLGTEASTLAAATGQLYKDIIFWTISERTGVQEIIEAKNKISYVKAEFERLNAIGAQLIPQITTCKQEADAMNSCEEQWKVDLGKELGNLGEEVDALRGSFADLTEKVGRTFGNLNRAETDLYENPNFIASQRPSNCGQVELREFVMSRDKFNTATEGLQNLAAKLVDDLKTMRADIIQCMDNIRENPVTSMREEGINHNIGRRIKKLSLKVASLQAQANSFASATSSITAAATTLIENTKEILVKVTKEMAKKFLLTAKMNFNAAELTIATSPLAREEIDLASLRASLTASKKGLAAACNSTRRRHQNESQWGKVTDCEKLKCALNLVISATKFIKVATHLATSTDILKGSDEPTIMMALHLTAVATNLVKATSYIVLNDSASVLDELDTIKEAADSLINTVSDLNKEEAKSPSLVYWWQYCAYSIFFPLCCLFNHLNYIIIAFIHDLNHATSVAIVYGIVTVSLYLLLDNIPYVLCCKRIKESLPVLQLIKILLVLVLLGYISMGIVLYFLLPIQNAFEDAANNFLSIYNTIAVFFTALVLYFVFKVRTRSLISIFTRALDSIFFKDEKAMHMNIRRRDWKELSEQDKDIEVAKSLLKHIKEDN